MNFHKMVRKRQRMLWTSMVAAAFALFGCQDKPVQSGGSMDETSTLSFHRKDGSPAAGARVQLYGSADTGVEPRVQLIADAQGGVDLPAPGRGYYNLVVRGRDGDALFQDSLYSNGTVFSIASDTLMRTGVLTGRIRVQPQHSPRIAWIHVLGAGIWSNVDDSGRFKLEGVPAGKYTVAAYTLVDGYTPTFAGIRTISDSTVDAGDIQMVFTGLPVVRNLEARFDTLAGLVYLRWDSIPLRETWRYRVYRDGAVLGETSGSQWIDSVRLELPKDALAKGKHTYQVVVASAERRGDFWESITIQVISPILYQAVRFDWKKQSGLPWSGGLYRIDTMGGRLACWRSSTDSISSVQLWLSTDSGKSWALIRDSLALDALPARYQQAWWSLRTRPLGDYADILTSPDGVDWTIRSSVPVGVDDRKWWITAEGNALHLLSGRATTGSNYALNVPGWSWEGAGFLRMRHDEEFGRTVPQPGMGWSKVAWIDGLWWNGWIIPSGPMGIRLGQAYVTINRDPEPLSDRYWDRLEMAFHVIKLGERFAVFTDIDAWSVDTTGSEVHSIAWPGSGPHNEILYGGGILSVSDAGIFLGSLQTDPLPDPRGTWVKKTEVPVRY
ncbi:MAG: hypothetical protein IPO40_20200 [Fibrobacteres bacterium]|nr:hypothetical protein [Fibrobacterota bacterium]